MRGFCHEIRPLREARIMTQKNVLFQKEKHVFGNRCKIFRLWRSNMPSMQNIVHIAAANHNIYGKMHEV